MHSQKGSILIASVWALSILTIFVGSLGFQAQEHILLMKHELSALEAKADFVSGLGLANFKIASDPKPHEDSSSDEWVGKLVLESPWKERVSVSIEDEESKMNLNDASEALLKEFLKLFEEEVGPLKGEKKDFVKQILKIRAKKRFESFEELYFMEDIEKEDLEALRPYVSVYPDEPLLNINTVKPLVLKALIHTLSGDDLAKKELEDKIMRQRKLSQENKDAGFLSEDLKPNSFMTKLKLTQSLPMIQIVNEFLQSFTTDSRTFALEIKSKTGKEAKAVIRQTGLPDSLEVLSWHEE